MAKGVVHKIMEADELKSRKNSARQQDDSEIKPYYSDAIPETDVILDEDTAQNVTNVEKADD